MVPSLIEINKAEQGYLGPDGNPVLGEAFGMLLARWASGERDRETALRMLFLIWYCNAEPPFLTGLPTEHAAVTLCLETFAALGGAGTTDPEIGFVVGLMADLIPWCLGDEGYWAEVGRTLTSRAAKLQPGGPPRAVFAGRGAYGQYFSHVLSARAGS
jgi:hypothetical protein